MSTEQRKAFCALMTLHFVHVHSPDLTICDFFLWGYIKSIDYIPPLLKDHDELKSRITDAINLVTVDMIQQVYEEFEYCLDVCRVSKGAH
jgi:hypothetical protein